MVIEVGDTVYTEVFNQLTTDRVVSEVVHFPACGKTSVHFEDGGIAALEHCHTNTLPKPTDFAPGEQVQVRAFGTWYSGTVVKLGRTKVKVTYASGTGKGYTKSLNMGQIRKRG